MWRTRLPVASSCRVLRPNSIVKQSKPQEEKKRGQLKGPPVKATIQKCRKLLPVVKEEKVKVAPRKKRVVSDRDSMTKKREKPKPKRSVQAMQLEVEPGKRARKNLMTVLEKKSVSKEVAHQYGGYYMKLEDFSKENGIPWPWSKDVADAALADFMDLLFLENRSPAEGEKILAALEFHQLELKGWLPRSKRALKGWRKEMPGKSRLPLPRLLMYGIAMKLISKGFREMGIKTILDFDCYFRPGESLTLKSRNVVAPVPGAGRQFQSYTIVIKDFESGKPDKVGIFDNAVKLDNPKTQWLGAQMHQLARRTNSQDDVVFTFAMDEYRRRFVEAGTELGIPGLHPYQLRHGGASEDLGSGLRDHPAVKQRGRWLTDQSVRRYAKIGRVQQLLSKLTSLNLQYCQWSEQNVAKVLSGNLPPRA